MSRVQRLDTCLPSLCLCRVSFRFSFKKVRKKKNCNWAVYILMSCVRLDHQPLFGKGARAPPPKGRRPDTRERRKSSLVMYTSFDHPSSLNYLKYLDHSFKKNEILFARWQAGIYIVFAPLSVFKEKRFKKFLKAVVTPWNLDLKLRRAKQVQ